jgi:hypothetical protein
MVRPDAPAEEKLKVITGAVAASPAERVTLLFFLCYDHDPALRQGALTAVRELPLALAAEIAAAPETHPRLVGLLQKLHNLPVEPPPEAQDIPVASVPTDEPEPAAAEPAETVADEEAKEEEEEEEEEEAFRSKYQLAQTMGVGEKIKMALTGDKEWRSLLIKDSNKLVNGAVVKNPRITEAEILSISKSVIQNDEILRVICQNKEWVKNYEIRKALVLNNKTPLPVALRFMGFLTEKDLSGMAKSKNISSVLSNQARRTLAGKKKS